MSLDVIVWLVTGALIVLVLIAAGVFMLSDRLRYKLISGIFLLVMFCLAISGLGLALSEPSSPQTTILYKGQQLTSEQLSQGLMDQLKEENPGKDIWVEVHFQ